MNLLSYYLHSSKKYKERKQNDKTGAMPTEEREEVHESGANLAYIMEVSTFPFERPYQYEEAEERVTSSAIFWLSK